MSTTIYPTTQYYFDNDDSWNQSNWNTLAALPRSSTAVDYSKHHSHEFVYYVSNPSATNVVVHHNGYGGGQSGGGSYTLNFYLWNYSTSAWSWIGAQSQSSNVDFAYTISSTNYANTSTGEITFMCSTYATGQFGVGYAGVSSVSSSITYDVPSGKIKVFNGSSWVAKPVKVWNGSSWVTKPLKRWNGSSWVTTTY